MEAWARLVLHHALTKCIQAPDLDSVKKLLRPEQTAGPTTLNDVTLLPGVIAGVQSASIAKFSFELGSAGVRFELHHVKIVLQQADEPGSGPLKLSPALWRGAIFKLFSGLSLEITGLTVHLPGSELVLSLAHASLGRTADPERPIWTWCCPRADDRRMHAQVRFEGLAINLSSLREEEDRCVVHAAAGSAVIGLSRPVHAPLELSLLLTLEQTPELNLDAACLEALLELLQAQPMDQPGLFKTSETSEEFLQPSKLAKAALLDPGAPVVHSTAVCVVRRCSVSIDELRVGVCAEGLALHGEARGLSARYDGFSKSSRVALERMKLHTKASDQLVLASHPDEQLLCLQVGHQGTSLEGELGGFVLCSEHLPALRLLVAPLCLHAGPLGWTPSVSVVLRHSLVHLCCPEGAGTLVGWEELRVESSHRMWPGTPAGARKVWTVEVDGLGSTVTEGSSVQELRKDFKGATRTNNLSLDLWLQPCNPIPAEEILPQSKLLLEAYSHNGTGRGTSLALPLPPKSAMPELEDVQDSGEPDERLVGVLSLCAALGGELFCVLHAGALSLTLHTATASLLLGLLESVQEAELETQLGVLVQSAELVLVGEGECTLRGSSADGPWLHATAGKDCWAGRCGPLSVSVTNEGGAADTLELPALVLSCTETGQARATAPQGMLNAHAHSGLRFAGRVLAAAQACVDLGVSLLSPCHLTVYGPDGRVLAGLKARECADECGVLGLHTVELYCPEHPERNTMTIDRVSALRQSTEEGQQLTLDAASVLGSVSPSFVPALRQLLEQLDELCCAHTAASETTLEMHVSNVSLALLKPNSVEQETAVLCCSSGHVRLQQQQARPAYECELHAASLLVGTFLCSAAGTDPVLSSCELQLQHSTGLTTVSVQNDSEETDYLALQMSLQKQSALLWLAEECLGVSSLCASWPCREGGQETVLCVNPANPPDATEGQHVWHVAIPGLSIQMQAEECAGVYESALQLSVSQLHLDSTAGPTEGELKAECLLRVDLFNAHNQGWEPVLEQAKISLTREAHLKEHTWQGSTGLQAVSALTLNLSDALGSTLQRLRCSACAMADSSEGISDSDDDDDDKVVARPTQGMAVSEETDGHGMEVHNCLGCDILITLDNRTEPMLLRAGQSQCVHHLSGFFAEVQFLSTSVFVEMKARDPGVYTLIDGAVPAVYEVSTCCGVQHIAFRTRMKLVNHAAEPVAVDIPGTGIYEGASVMVPPQGFSSVPLPILVNLHHTPQESTQHWFSGLSSHQDLHRVTMGLLPGTRVAGVDRAGLANLVRSPTIFRSKIRGSNVFFVAVLSSSGGDSVVDIWPPVTVCNRLSASIEVRVRGSDNPGVIIQQGVSFPLFSIEPEYSEGCSATLEIRTDGSEEWMAVQTLSQGAEHVAMRFEHGSEAMVHAETKHWYSHATQGVRGLREWRATEVCLSVHFAVYNFTTLALHVSCPGVNALLQGKQTITGNKGLAQPSIQDWYSEGSHCEFSCPFAVPELQVQLLQSSQPEHFHLSEHDGPVPLTLTSASGALLEIDCLVRRGTTRCGAECVVVSLCPCATVANATKFRLLADVGLDSAPIALKQGLMLPLYQRQLRVRPDPRGPPRWTWSFPMQLSAQHAILKCHRTQDIPEDPTEARHLFMSCSKNEAHLQPHWELASMPQDDQSLVKLENHTGSEVVFSQRGFESPWQKQTVHRGEESCFCWESDQPPRHMLVEFPSTGGAISIVLDNDSVLEGCHACQSEMPHDDCAEHAVSMQSLVAFGQRVLRISPAYSKLQFGGSTSGLADDLAGALSPRTLSVRASSEMSHQEASFRASLTTSPTYSTSLAIPELNVCWIGGEHAAELLQCCLGGVACTVSSQEVTLQVDTVVAHDCTTEPAQLVLEFTEDKPAFKLSGMVVTQQESASRFERAQTQLTLDWCQLKLGRLQLVLREAVAVAVAQIWDRLQVSLGGGQQVLVHEFLVQALALEVGLQWQPRATTITTSQPNPTQLECFERVASRLRPLTCAFRHLFVEHRASRSMRGSVLELAAEIAEQSLEAAVANFLHLQSSREFPEPRVDASVRPARKALPNGVFPASWDALRDRRLLEEHYGRGGFFGRADELWLSVVSEGRQMFVTSAWVFVADCESNTMVWEAAHEDIEDAVNIGGRGLQVLCRDTARDSVGMDYLVKNEQSVAAWDELRIFGLHHDLTELLNLQRLIKWVVRHQNDETS